MKRFLLCILSFMLLHSLTSAQTALIEIPFTFSDGVGGSRILTAGLDPTATDGVDSDLGESELPPPPFGFYTRFTLPNSSVQSWKDIRLGDDTPSSEGNQIHTINYQLGTGSAGLTINWDLPSGIELNLQDPFGGVLFNVDFPSGSGNYTITNLALTSLLMTIKYVQAPFPVELTSFSAKAQGDKIILTWQTATEINNYGFDIERKVLNGVWLTLGFVEGNGNSNSTKSYSFEDTNISSSGKYFYRLKQIDTDGSYEYSNIVEVNVDIMPKEYVLYQNYPNPFNPSTKIKYALPQSSKVILTVYNAIGEVSIVLVNEVQDEGFHEIDFDASNLPSGIYLYRLITNENIQVKKMILLK